MTAVSETGETWVFDDSGFGRVYIEHSPLGVNIVRYWIVNNVLHSYEVCGQHRINWVARTTADRITLQPAAADTFELLTSIHFAGTMRYDGQHFRFIWRLGGSIDDAAETATFRVVLSNPRTAPIGTSDGDLDHEDVTTTSTTDAWLVATSHKLFAPEYQDLPYAVQIPTVRGLVSTDAVNALAAFYRLDIWVKCTNAGGGAIPTARLSGLYMREFIGG